MATPIGHAVLGIGIGRFFGPANDQWKTVLLRSALYAILPDFDFIPGILAGRPALFHQGVSHSFVVGILASAFGALLIRIHGWSRFTTMTLLFSCYCSHLLLDLFGPDQRVPFGIPLFWPVSDAAFFAPVQLLMRVRHARSTDATIAEWIGGVFSVYNLGAIAVEFTVIAGFMVLAWTIARFRSGRSVTGRKGRRE